MRARLARISYESLTQDLDSYVFLTQGVSESVEDSETHLILKIL